MTGRKAGAKPQLLGILVLLSSFLLFFSFLDFLPSSELTEEAADSRRDSVGVVVAELLRREPIIARKMLREAPRSKMAGLAALMTSVEAVLGDIFVVGFVGVRPILVRDGIVDGKLFEECLFVCLKLMIEKKKP